MHCADSVCDQQLGWVSYVSYACKCPCCIYLRSLRDESLAAAAETEAEAEAEVDADDDDAPEVEEVLTILPPRSKRSMTSKKFLRRLSMDFGI